MFVVVSMWAFSAPVQRQARIFKIGHLTTPPDDARTPDLVPGGLLTYTPDQDYIMGDSGLIDYSEEGSIELDPLYSAFVKHEDLVELIRTFVAEDSWSNKRNDIKAGAEKLTVVQTGDVLRQIESMLTVLYARRMRRIDIAVSLLPPSVFEQVVKEEKLDAGALLFPEDLFDRAVAHAGDAAITWRRTADEGEGCAFRPLYQRMSMKDIDVNQTGTAPVVNPLMGLLRNGVGVELRCARTPLENTFLMDFTVSRITTSPAGNIRKMPQGDLELPHLGCTSLDGSVLCPAGKTVLLGRFTWSQKQPAPFVVLARIRTIPQQAIPKHSFEIIEVGGLLRPRLQTHRRFQDSYSGFVEEDSRKRVASYYEDEKPLFSPEGLLRRARSVLPSELQHHPGLRLKRAGSGLFVAVLGDRDATARAASRIRTHFKACFKGKSGTVEARVLQGTCSADDLEKIKDMNQGAVLLVPGWREQVAFERETLLSLAGLENTTMRLFAAAGRRYVSDVEQVSGGTTSMILQVSDPIIGWAGTGCDVEVRIKPVPHTPWVQIHATGTVAETTWKNSADNTVKPGGPHGLRPAAAKITIDLPEQQADSWQHVATVPAGRACLLNAFPDPKEPSKMRVLVVEPLMRK